MKRSEIFFSALLIPVDLIALISAFLVAYQVRDQVTVALQDAPALASRLQYNPYGELLPLDNYLHYIAFIIPAMLIIFALTGLYAIRSRTSWFTRILHIIIGVSVGECFILLLFLLKKEFFLPRATVLYSWLLAIIFVILGRLIILAIQKVLYTRNIGTVRVGVIGSTYAAEQLAGELQNRPAAGYKLAAHFADATVKEVARQIDNGKLDELIVVSEHYNNEDLITLRNHCLEQHIGFSLVPQLLSSLPSSFSVRSIVGLPVVEVRPTPLDGWGRVVKRLFDIVAALILIILFSPLYIAIAIWLKTSSPGPLIYRHKRIGKNHRPIHIWKFRSFYWEFCTGSPEGDAKFAKMLKDNPAWAAEWEATTKLKDDPRISPPGKFLRKTRLDELPQFFNVISGVLSIVGPRPIIEDEVRKFGEKARILFTVKPGITGLWQVSGGNDVTFDERVALEARYIERWNLWLDVVIMAKTGLLLVKRGKHDGAY